MENVEALRKAAEQLVQKRLELEGAHSRAVQKRNAAVSRSHASSILATSEELEQASRPLMACCAEVEAALEEYRSALDGEFLADNRKAEKDLSAIRSRLAELRAEVAEYEARERNEFQRIAPEVNRIAERKRAGEKFIADTEFDLRLCVESIRTAKTAA